MRVASLTANITSSFKTNYTCNQEVVVFTCVSVGEVQQLMANIITTGMTNSGPHEIVFNYGHGQVTPAVQMMGRAVAILQNFSGDGQRRYQYTSDIILKFFSELIINIVINCSSEVHNDYDIKGLSLSSRLNQLYNY